MKTESEWVLTELQKIRHMSHEEMARLFRFAPSGHRYFDIDGPFWEVFQNRFKGLGGMTNEISKKIGWGEDEKG